jgi:uncharacterized membrane protein
MTYDDYGDPDIARERLNAASQQVQAIQLTNVAALSPEEKARVDNQAERAKQREADLYMRWRKLLDA